MNGHAMKVVRLPGIHHDGNVVLVSGSLGHLLINAGTSWYQALQVERITGQLGKEPLDRILLTSRRFPVSGGAAHVAEAFGEFLFTFTPMAKPLLRRVIFSRRGPIATTLTCLVRPPRD